MWEELKLIKGEWVVVATYPDPMILTNRWIDHYTTSFRFVEAS